MGPPASLLPPAGCLLLVRQLSPLWWVPASVLVRHCGALAASRRFAGYRKTHHRAAFPIVGSREELIPIYQVTLPFKTRLHWASLTAVVAVVGWVEPFARPNPCARGTIVVSGEALDPTSKFR